MKEDLTIVAISGWKRSGKDTMAEHMMQYHSFTRFSFAEPLKRMGAEEYGVPLSHMYDDEYKESPIMKYPVQSTDPFLKNIHDHMCGEFRSQGGRVPSHLWTYGGKTRGLIGHDDEGANGLVSWETVYWTPRAIAIFKGSGNRAINKEYWTDRLIKEINDSTNNRIVISDLRFKTETAKLKAEFGDNIFFVRVNRFDSVESNDSSEHDLDSFDFGTYFDNTGTKEVLYLQIDNYFNGVHVG